MVVKAKQLTDRSIYVYLPTLEMAQDWKTKADKARVSISKFVIEHVENSLKQEQEKQSYVSRVELLKQLKEKDEEIAKLRRENKLLDMLSRNQERELKALRAKPFSDDKGDFQGVREFDIQLIQCLKKDKLIDSDRLLQVLGISPKDSDLVKGVNRQLRILQAYGLVEPTARGWRWTG
jgi:hypothetical protein